MRSALGALAALVCATTSAACELPPGVRLESERLALAFWTIPAKIAVGQPFVLELAACPRTSAPVPERVKLDAYMPEHVVPMGGGRFHSEGWLFHMPGRWQFRFDVGTEHLTHSVQIE